MTDWSKVGDFVAFLINCVFLAVLCILLTLFVHFLFKDWLPAILAGLGMALDGFFLTVHHYSLFTGRRLK